MNLPTFSTQGKSQDWIFYAVAGTLCLLYMVMYTFTPPLADDLWYLANTDIHADVWHRFIQTQRTGLDHWNIDTGRLSCVIAPAFISLFPKFVYGFVSSLASFLTLLLGCRLTSCRLVSLQSAILLIVVNFVFPWFEYMYTIVFSINYIWPIALGGGFVCLLVKTEKEGRMSTTANIGLLVYGIVTGWWHEGMTVPMAIGIFVYFFVMKKLPGYSSRFLISGLILGILCIMCMPALWAMTGNRGSFLVKSTWYETLINIVAFNCMFYIYLVLLIIWALKRKTRKKLFGNRRNIAIAWGTLACGLIGTLIFIKYFNGARTGAFNQIMSTLTIMYYMGQLKNVRQRHTILFCVAGMISIFNVAWAIDVQLKLNKEIEDVREQAANPLNPGVAFYDQTPIRIGPDFLKPTYMVLNTKFGLREITLLPKALQDFSEKKAARCSDDSLLIFKNNLVYLHPAPKDRFDVMLTTGDNKETLSRVQYRQFKTSDGADVTYLELNINTFYKGVVIKDARIVR